MNPYFYLMLQYGFLRIIVMRCAIWYHLVTLYQMRIVTFSKVTLLNECFFTFFKLYKWYQIVQRITYEEFISHFFLFRKFIFTKKPSIGFSSASKNSKEYISEHITEHLLHDHYDIVEKQCYNRSTKIDLLGNCHLFWSQMLSGYLCYPEFVFWENQVSLNS